MKDEQQRIKDLTAKDARRRKPKSSVLVALTMIDDGRKSGKTKVRVLAGSNHAKKELEKRGFAVEDTGLVWHISW